MLTGLKRLLKGIATSKPIPLPRFRYTIHRNRLPTDVTQTAVRSLIEAEGSRNNGLAENKSELGLRLRSANVLRNIS